MADQKSGDEQSTSADAASSEVNAPLEAPCRQAKTPQSAQRKMVAAVLVLVIAGCLVYIGRGVHRMFRLPEEETTGVTLTPEGARRGGLPRPVGSPEAGVRIEACMGGCVSWVMVDIADVVRAWPDQVRAEFYDFNSPEGQAFASAHDSDLACILFNGSKRIELPDEHDGTRTVHFYGPPGGAYTPRDIAEALRVQFLKVYGKAPPDFTQRTKILTEGRNAAVDEEI